MCSLFLLFREDNNSHSFYYNIKNEKKYIILEILSLRNPKYFYNQYTARCAKSSTFGL